MPADCAGVAPAALNLTSSFTLPRTITENDVKSRAHIMNAMTRAAMDMRVMLSSTELAASSNALCASARM